MYERRMSGSGGSRVADEVAHLTGLPTSDVFLLMNPDKYGVERSASEIVTSLAARMMSQKPTLRFEQALALIGEAAPELARKFSEETYSTTPRQPVMTYRETPAAPVDNTSQALLREVESVKQSRKVDTATAMQIVAQENPQLYREWHSKTYRIPAGSPQGRAGMGAGEEVV